MEGLLDERLELFFGAASDALVRVYARLRLPEGRGDFELAGTLRGPHCQYADTLPATYPLVDDRRGTSLVAEGIVPEPCFWTPEMPQLYDAQVQLLESGREVARAQRLLGIRRLGAAGRSLYFDGKGWVLRGVAVDEVPKQELSAWHEAETAMVVRQPSDALCDAASRVGVLVVAEVAAGEVREIRRLGRWPAVGIIALGGDVTDEVRSLGQNAILAQRISPGQTPAAWADLTMVTIAAGEPVDPRLADCGLPTIAMRRGGAVESVAAGRRACDWLQRDLAQYGQLAGYIV